MSSFTTWDGLTIAYQEWGDASAPGPVVVLHHGFVADADTNWVATGVVAALEQAGRRVLAPDARGHGCSQAPHDPGAYGEDRMARDLAALADELALEELDLVGYSMGAVVSLLFAASDARVRRLVVGGVGSGVVECGGVDRRSLPNDSIIEALIAEDPETVRGSPGGWFRVLADAVGADRLALAAQARSVYRGGVDLSAIRAPTLLLAGRDDPLALRPRVLAGAIPLCTLRLVDGDHATALADPEFAASIVHFLG